MAKAGVKYLDVLCALCGKARLDHPKGGQWWEVLAWGPKRRCHEACFREVMDVIRDLPDDKMMHMIEEAETKRAAA